jgi:ACS family pantothenate transporter-like MFS transporter
MLTLLYIFFNNGGGLASQPAFALWLKYDLHYSVEAINAYPTLTPAVQVVSTLVYAWSSDSLFRGARWPPMIFSGLALIVVHSSLAAWSIPLAWHWACYILAGLGGGISGLCFAWAHEICNDDVQERALVTGCMNEMAYVIQAWLPLLVWKQVEAPKYRKGVLTMIGLNMGMIATALAIRWLHQKELRRKKLLETDDSE